MIGAVFALSSVVVPFCMGAALGGIASGRVPVGNALGEPFGSWLNPTSALVGCLAVATGAYLGAVFMAADSIRAQLPDLVRAFRARALGAGLTAGTLAIGGVLVIRDDAPALWSGLTSGAGLAFVLLSVIVGIATLVLVWRGRFEVARYTSALAVGAVTVGWALAQQPYLLPGRLTLEEAAAAEEALSALLVSVGVGLLLLVPSLVLLYRLVLQGRLDQRYEPLDQPFRPLSASDHPPDERAAWLPRLRLSSSARR